VIEHEPGMTDTGKLWPPAGTIKPEKAALLGRCSALVAQKAETAGGTMFRLPLYRASDD